MSDCRRAAVTALPRGTQLLVLLLAASLALAHLPGCGRRSPAAERALGHFIDAMGDCDYERAWTFAPAGKRRELSLESFKQGMKEYNDPEFWKTARILSSAEKNGKAEVKWQNRYGGPYSATLVEEAGEYRVVDVGL